MRLAKTPTAARSGFTLVELLVAFALIVFIMSVLAQAFHAAGKVVSDLKKVSDMEENLRGVMVLLRRDLAANHFDESLPGSQRKMSQSTFWDDHLGTPVAPRTPNGFFRLYQFGAPSQIPAPVAPGEIPTHTMVSSSLHFTVYRPTDTPGNMFSATLPAAHDLLTKGTPEDREQRFQSAAVGVNPYRSPWGEVAWWMTPLGATTTGDPADPALFFLRRRQRAMAEKVPALLAEAAGTAADREVSVPNLAVAQVNDPVRITAPAMRWNMTPLAAGDTQAGVSYLTTEPKYAGTPATLSPAYPADVLEDIVLPDVLSFEVRVLLEGDSEFRDLSDPLVQAGNGGNPAWPAAGPAFCFDTWTNQTVGRFNYSQWNVAGSQATLPLRVRIRAIQATLRIWDSKSQLARQMTMIQDM